MKKPARPAKPAPKAPGWNPPAKGPARDRYTQEYIAGKLTQLTQMIGSKKGK
jgi:hypothetical protein